MLSRTRTASSVTSGPMPSPGRIVSLTSMRAYSNSLVRRIPGSSCRTLYTPQIILLLAVVIGDQVSRHTNRFRVVSQRNREPPGGISASLGCSRVRRQRHRQRLHLRGRNAPGTTALLLDQFQQVMIADVFDLIRKHYELTIDFI